jgi:hypothetical protein
LALAKCDEVKKPRKEAAEPAQWTVYLMRAKLTWLGIVDARDEAEPTRNSQPEQHDQR